VLIHPDWCDRIRTYLTTRQTFIKYTTKIHRLNNCLCIAYTTPTFGTVVINPLYFTLLLCLLWLLVTYMSDISI